MTMKLYSIQKDVIMKLLTYHKVIYKVSNSNNKTYFVYYFNNLHIL